MCKNRRWYLFGGIGIGLLISFLILSLGKRGLGTPALYAGTSGQGGSLFAVTGQSQDTLYVIDSGHRVVMAYRPYGNQLSLISVRRMDVDESCYEYNTTPNLSSMENYGGCKAQDNPLKEPVETGLKEKKQTR